MLTTEDRDITDKVLRLLGLAMRARKLACGREACGISMKKKKARLLIVASDAAVRTVQDLERLAAHHNVPVIAIGSLEELGRCTGTDKRACVAVEDEGFSSGISSYIESTVK